jgi:D-alanyl-D-alanine carboxypeptidase
MRNYSALRIPNSAFLEYNNPMKKPVWLTLPLLALLTLTLTSCAPQGKPAASIDEIRPKLDKVLAARMKEFGVPATIIGIWLPGKGEYVVARGMADLKTGRAANLKDKFRIACLTKSFTSTVIFQLIDEGRFTLDTPLSQFDLGLTVPNAENITVRQLLSHTSGLFNFTADPKFWVDYKKNPLKAWTSKELVLFALTHPADFAPGKDYRYNNTDYELLKLIIEKETGRRAENVIRQRIINRLGLWNTSYPFASNPNVPTPHLNGYVAGEGKKNDTTDLNDLMDLTESAPFAEGMISNLADLKVWAKAFALGKLISPASQKERLSYLVPKDKPQAGLGFLYFVGLIGRSGEIPGYNSAMYYEPKSGLTIVATVNRYPCKTEGAVDQIWIPLVETIIKEGLLKLGK